MTPFAFRLAAATVAASVLAVAVCATGPATVPAKPYAGYRVASAGMVGQTGCSAASCHGGDGPKGAAGCENTTWAAADPHRRAFAVLHNAKSRRMVELLGGPPAPRNELCLRCHGAFPANLAFPLAATADEHRVAGCENCHGAGEKYLAAHYTPGWKALTDRQKAEDYGLLPLKDLGFRVQVCAGCHVGEPGREVDHRLIAAGHPALRFEFAGYHAEPVYTKHWRGEPGYGPDAEAWMWAIGQVGSAKAAAALSAHRAAEAETNPNRDWPELSEFACFSCHQELSPESTLGPARKRDATTAPRPGTTPWGSWYFPLPLEMAKLNGAGWLRAGCAPAGPITLTEMFRRTDRPDPANARELATTAARDLDRWLSALQTSASRRSAADPLRPDELRAALGEVLGFADRIPDTGAAGTDWDRHAQGFLGTAALYRAGGSRDALAERLLRGAAADLSFPPGKDGPRRWDAADEAKFRERWREIRRQLEPGGPAR
ncbi:MAG: multiheme c-type cytochrome [Fimbriiglobus sp.]